MYETWRIWMCLTDSNVSRLLHLWRDSYICDVTHTSVTWLIHLWRDSYICDVTHTSVTWLIHLWRDSYTCDVTHLGVYMTDSNVSRLLHMWRDSFRSVDVHSKMSHVTYAEVVTHLNLSCTLRNSSRHICKSHVTYEWVASHMNESRHICKSRDTFESVMYTPKVQAWCHQRRNVFLMKNINYVVATISRLLKIIGLISRIWSLLEGSFAKETYNFKEPTNRSHPPIK